MKSIVTKCGLSVKQLSDGSLFVEDFRGAFIKKSGVKMPEVIQVRVHPDGTLEGHGASTGRTRIVDAIHRYRLSK